MRTFNGGIHSYVTVDTTTSFKIEFNNIKWRRRVETKYRNWSAAKLLTVSYTRADWKNSLKLMDSHYLSTQTNTELNERRMKQSAMQLQCYWRQCLRGSSQMNWQTATCGIFWRNYAVQLRVWWWTLNTRLGNISRKLTWSAYGRGVLLNWHLCYPLTGESKHINVLQKLWWSELNYTTNIFCK